MLPIHLQQLNGVGNVFCINVWTGIVGVCVVGLSQQLTGSVEATGRYIMQYMHKVALVHFRRAMPYVLSKWWICIGPTGWPPDLSHFNPLHFYLRTSEGPCMYSSCCTSPLHVGLSTSTTEPLNECCGMHWISRKTLSTYFKCTLSAITHRWSVSRHKLIWTFFLILVCGTQAQICLYVPYNIYVHMLGVPEGVTFVFSPHQPSLLSGWYQGSISGVKVAGE
jgi:hypothetical protein